MMSALDAAYVVLKSVGKPMPYEALTKEILRRGLWRSDGETPKHNVRAPMGKEISDLGSRSRFAKFGRGIYGLSEWRTKPPEPEHESPTTKSAKMSFTDAAEHVLRDVGHAMPYKELWEEIGRRRLVTTSSVNPWQTLYASVLLEVERNNERGTPSRFRRIEKGMIALSPLPRRDDGGEQRHRKGKGREETSTVQVGAQFEDRVARLFERLGFQDVQKTRPGKDAGVDVRAVLALGDGRRIRIVAQAKDWSKVPSLGSKTVRELRGTLEHGESGVLVTSGDFSKDAMNEARAPGKRPIMLVNGSDLRWLETAPREEAVQHFVDHLR